MPRLSGKRALVTGAARGIGAAISAEFVAEGAEVIVADIRDADGLRLADSLGQLASYHHLDVTSEEEWGALPASLNGPVDVLVNNAGAVGSFAPLIEMQLDDWRAILDLNLTSVFLGMRAILPMMLGSGGGSIINLSSISGVVGHEVAAAYQSAKGGVRILTKNAAVTYARRNIRANSLHPGIIQTPMVDAQPPEATRAFIAGTPMARAGEPRDVAFAAVYLASDEAQFVTGAEFYVDGGFVAQ